ncbi:hypothetical protein ACTRXD_14395 [Nitrospira sp. T9]|uniref:hypothetical protein n=1 Tax=unclassified Nitrospira TaxID=2652172 RepID=UPI003F9A1D76
MIKLASNFTILTFGLVFSAGMLLLPVTGQAGQGMGSTTGSSDSVPEVQSQFESGADIQWSDQLQRERDQALQAGKGSDDSDSGMKSIQGQTSSGRMGSGAENQENARLIQDRDQFLKERDALQKETSDLRQERDRAMSSISGGSALDAVDRSMSVTPGH